MSAQTILRRAATSGLSPGQITRVIYQLTSSSGYSGTTQFWQPGLRRPRLLVSVEVRHSSA